MGIEPINEIDKQRLMDNIITRFFEGEDHFSRENDNLIYIGFVWVSKHTGYDTLTFEPNGEGGQYEIAVRFRVKANKEDLNDAEWQGYKVANPLKDKLYGVNTRGH